MRANFMLRVGALALVALVAIEIGAAPAAEFKTVEPNGVVNTPDQAKTAGAPKIRRTIRVVKQPSASVPVAPKASQNEPQTVTNPNHIDVSNGASTNQVDVKPNISIELPQAAAAAPANGQTQNEDDQEDDVQDEGDDADLQVVPYVDQSVQEAPREDQMVVAQSNNRLDQLMTNSGNEAVQLSDNSGNTLKKIVRNSDQTEELHIEGVGNKKVTKIANVGNTEEHVIQDTNNKVTSKQVEGGAGVRPQVNNDQAPSPVGVVAGLPVANGSPLVQINMNSERPALSIEPSSASLGLNLPIWYPQQQAAAAANLQSYYNYLAQNPSLAGANPSQYLPLALAGHPQLQQHLAQLQMVATPALSPSVASPGLAMNQAPVVGQPMMMMQPFMQPFVYPSATAFGVTQGPVGVQEPMMMVSSREWWRMMRDKWSRSPQKRKARKNNNKKRRQQEQAEPKEVEVEVHEEKKEPTERIVVVEQKENKPKSKAKVQVVSEEKPVVLKVAQKPAPVTEHVVEQVLEHDDEDANEDEANDDEREEKVVWKRFRVPATKPVKAKTSGAGLSKTRS